MCSLLGTETAKAEHPKVQVQVLRHPVVKRQTKKLDQRYGISSYKFDDDSP
jgi:hypothetical protein